MYFPFNEIYVLPILSQSLNILLNPLRLTIRHIEDPH